MGIVFFLVFSGMSKEDAEAAYIAKVEELKKSCSWFSFLAEAKNKTVFLESVCVWVFSFL